MEPIVVTSEVRVPEDALSFRAVRAGGPGGQNVNKVASKVELRVDLARITGLTEGAAARLAHAVRNQLDAEGLWLVVSSLTRDQIKNLEDAREKVRAKVAAALKEPIRRIATQPTRGSQRRRVEGKRKAAEKKAGRSGKWD